MSDDSPADSPPDSPIPAPPALASGSHCTLQDYRKLYQQSLADPDAFWAQQAKRLDWFTTPTRIANWSYDPVDIRWFDDGVLNICYNALDRHIEQGRGDAIALICEPDEPEQAARTLTYAELHSAVVHMAATLKNLGVTKGERVTISMPMVAEGTVAMLACARIGAVHSVIFGGFSAEAIAGRIADCKSRWIICGDIARRGGKVIPLKANVDAALEKLDALRDTGRDTGQDTEQGAAIPKVEAVLVVRNTFADYDESHLTMREGRDHWYHDCAAASQASADPTCPCEPMQAEDPLFILYTSGSTGKPKGLVHSTGGYAVWVATTFHYIFDYREGELYWCTADIGWITGHSYIVYGPLLNGAQVLIYEGVPSYPDHDRFWQIVAKYRVSIFYTAPTAIRALMREGDHHVAKHDLSSLRVLGTVGEPINPEAWRWYYHHVGGDSCAIVDTWWQTETGGIMISTLPAAHMMKPGSAGQPFFGIRPQLINSKGAEVEGEGIGNLCIAASWPGQARSVYGDHDRFVATYFSDYVGKYFTGDGCRRDSDGYYWITGRVDDVINVSGHRMGTAEIESALVLHSDVAEAAVVGFPHAVKGQALYCYVTLNAEVTASAALEKELREHVRTIIGAIATPEHIQFAPALPKTRSGKIMRRILRKIAENDCDSLGDTSTLADPSLVADLIANRPS